MWKTHSRVFYVLKQMEEIFVFTWWKQQTVVAYSRTLTYITWICLVTSLTVKQVMSIYTQHNNDNNPLINQ